MKSMMMFLNRIVQVVQIAKPVLIAASIPLLSMLETKSNCERSASVNS